MEEGKCNGFVQKVEEEHAETLDEGESKMKLEEADDGRYTVREYSSFHPCEKELFSYECNTGNYRFGLIRGYHRGMYDKRSSEDLYFGCRSFGEDGLNRMKRKNRNLSYQVCGLIAGAAFVFLGTLSLIVTYFLSSYDFKEHFWSSLNLPSAYIQIVAVTGLIVMTVGTALISLCLLVPTVAALCRNNSEMPVFWCSRGDLYVKNAEDMAAPPNQFLYFDAPSIHGKFVSNPDVKRVQPASDLIGGSHDN